VAFPYISRRTGSTQWLMQRVSAFLLVGLAFTHFAIQHFTSDAVSTGLTVAARLNNPWWQAYYALFIALALYHGINGLCGIIRDYNPRPNLRLPIELVIWTLAAAFGARAIINIAHPVPVEAVKANYAARGFPAGASRGNPPALAINYDFRSELRELLLLEYYLEHHTHRTEATALAEVFAHQAGKPVDASQVAAAGLAFDTWLNRQLASDGPAQELRDRHALFSSTYEFALWAKDVRRANANARRGLTTEAADIAREDAILSRLRQLPVYSAVQAH
jgi:succinate dehydrogenase / fumarate reductase membrane anchor subunit